MGGEPLEHNRQSYERAQRVRRVFPPCVDAARDARQRLRLLVCALLLERRPLLEQAGHVLDEHHLCRDLSCGSSERRLMGVRRAAPPAPLREGPHVRAVMWASHLMGKMRGVPCYHGDDWRAPALRLPLDPADATESTDSPCRTTGGGPEDGASAFRRFLALTCAHSAAHASPHTVGCEGCAAAAARDPTHALACRTRPQLPHALRLDPCGGTGCDLGLQRSRGEARAALCVLGANPRSV